MEIQTIKFPENYTYRPTYELPDNTMPDFFAYQSAVFSNLAAATGTSSQQIQIQNDADFELRCIAYYFNLANAAFMQSTRPIPNCTLMITDTGAGRNLFSNPVPIASIAWNGEGDRRDLPWPKIFGRNASVQLTVANFDAAVATGQLYITLLGRKLFQRNPR